MNDSFVSAPQSEEAERALIGHCLLNPGNIGAIVSTVQPEDFYSFVRKEVFLALVQRVKNNQPIDPVELDTSGALSQMDYATYADAVSSLENWKVHARILREMRLRRAMMFIADKMYQEAQDSSRDISGVLDCGLQNMGYAARLMPQPEGNPEDIMRAFELNVRRWEKLPLLRTGITALDEAFGGGVLPGGVMSLVGGDGSMKTSLALKCVETYLAEVAKPVIYLSLDMEAYRITTRRLLPLMDCREIRAIEEIRRNSEDYRWAAAELARRDKGLIKVFDGSHTVEDIQRHLEALRPGLVVIDYLTAIDGFKSEYEAMSSFCRTLRSWKRRYSTTWLIINQMSEMSKAAQRQGDFAGRASGGNDIARVADVMIELYKDLGVSDDDRGAEDELAYTPPPQLIATVTKSRYGQNGTSWSLDYLGHSMSFTGKATKTERQKPRKAQFQRVSRTW